MMPRLATDRLRLGQTRGLQFWRLLGTGRGSSTAPSVDLRRTALFAVWVDELALNEFRADHPLTRRWQRAEEAWHTQMTMVGGGGSWHGRSFSSQADGDVAIRTDGPIAVLTHATVAARSWRSFRRSSVTVANGLSRADGLLASVGIGEAPLGRLGTFSLWKSPAHAGAFMASPVHRAAAERARAEEWFTEELFGRFVPLDSSGCWGGSDPLAGLLDR